MSSSTAAVLAVDDNATIRRAISMRLGSKGYHVVTAHDGPSALALTEQRSFDVVLLDLQMPGMHGDEVLKRLRQRFSDTELPVIMLAASSDKDDIRRTLDLGANDYVTKPSELPILIARIKTQLSLKRTADELRRAEFASSTVNHHAKDVERTIDQLARDRVHEEFLGDFESTNEYRYHVMYDHMPITCFTLNNEGEIIFANRFGIKLLGYSQDDFNGKSIYDLYAPEDRAQAAEHLASVSATDGRLHRWDIRRVKKSGSVFWVRETAIAMGRGDNSMLLLTCEDINDTYLLTQTLTYQATRDELTGLANRKNLEQRLTQVIESAHAENTEHSLAIIDLDQFKIINDTCGHSAGDELLRQVARRIKSLVRKRDTLARLGGDEFALLMEDCELEQAEKDVENLRLEINKFEFSFEGRTHKITASVGLVAVNSQCEDSNYALSMADTACFAAKDAGRNQIHSFQKDNLAVVRHHGEMLWATRINDALADDRFELYYQRIAPITESAAKPGAHYEMLIRMRDEMGDVVTPAEFLPAAERYNLADKIDLWVVRNALEWLYGQGHRVAELGLCAINLSGQSIGNTDILQSILNQLSDYQVPAAKLCFEVTETAAVSDLVKANHFITRLQEEGCRFALDDFGSGFSSFAYLKKLPVDFLKIDGSFVRDIGSDSIDLAMVRSINEIGHLMGKQTIAEFVEDRVVLDILRGVGVDFAQGFEIGRPQPLSGYGVGGL